MIRDTAQFKRPLVPEDLIRMCLPEEFWRVKTNQITTDNKLQQIVWNYMVRIDEMFDKGAGLILSGPTGVGKTSIAAVVMKEARSRGYLGYYLTVAQLRDSLQTSAQFDYEQTVLERIRMVELLILDDFSVADTTNHKFSLDLRRLAEIVASRGNQHLITLITTQITPPQFNAAPLREFYESVQGHMVLLPVTGPNLKKLKSKELQNLIITPPDIKSVSPEPKPEPPESVKPDPDKGNS